MSPLPYGRKKGGAGQWGHFVGQFSLPTCAIGNGTRKMRLATPHSELVKKWAWLRTAPRKWADSTVSELPVPTFHKLSAQSLQDMIGNRLPMPVVRSERRVPCHWQLDLQPLHRGIYATRGPKGWVDLRQEPGAQVVAQKGLRAQGLDVNCGTQAKGSAKIGRETGADEESPATVFGDFAYLSGQVARGVSL